MTVSSWGTRHLAQSDLCWCNDSINFANNIKCKHEQHNTAPSVKKIKVRNVCLHFHLIAQQCRHNTTTHTHPQTHNVVFMETATLGRLNANTMERILEQYASNPKTFTSSHRHARQFFFTTFFFRKLPMTTIKQEMPLTMHRKVMQQKMTFHYPQHKIYSATRRRHHYANTLLFNLRYLSVKWCGGLLCFGFISQSLLNTNM